MAYEIHELAMKENWRQRVAKKTKVALWKGIC